MSERTKGEWRAIGRTIHANGHQIANIHFVNDEDYDVAVSNAEFICRAVNNHEALISVLKEIVETGGLGAEGYAHEKAIKLAQKVLEEVK